MQQESTWFVRLKGHTLGPISLDELKASLREGEIGPDDKVHHLNDPTWHKVSEYQDLSAYWQSFRAPVASFDLPPPAKLWKKPPAPVAAPVPVVEIPAAPIELVPEIAEPAKAVVAKPPKTKPSKKAAPKVKVKTKSATEKQRIKPVEAPAPAPVAAPVLNEAVVAAEILKALEAATARKQEIVTAFPELPPIAEVRTARESRPFFAHQESSLTQRLKIWRIAALAAFVVIVAGIAYWAGNKTRDLKELPLPDPSSPTTQLPAVSDPIQPLRAPTRPQRD